MWMPGHISGDEDRASARAPKGHPLRDALAELRDEAVVLSELADRCALAAGNDERVDLVELLGAADVDSRTAETLEGIEVLAKVALKSEDAGAS